MSEAIDETLKALEVLVGAWDMTSSLAPDPATAPRARTTFEWLTGKRFLIQRWEVDLAEAPDGIAIIGADRARSAYVQHYFDSRGVARIYEMAFADRHWTLQRIASVPDFSQRFTGTVSEDGNTIAGHWEMSNDGSSWTPDFDLTYKRVT